MEKNMKLNTDFVTGRVDNASITIIRRTNCNATARTKAKYFST